jgi:hypothetical protein
VTMPVWAKRMTKAEIVDAYIRRDEDFSRLQSAIHIFLLHYNFDWPLWDQDEGVDEILERLKYIVRHGKEPPAGEAANGATSAARSGEAGEVTP